MRLLGSRLAIALAIATGACGGDDTGTDSSDSGTPDGATVDAADGSTSGCGNGALDEGEACDGTVFRDATTCSSLSLPAGTLGCTGTCEVDTTGCAVCDDGICSDGENASTCAADCGVRAISAGRTHTCGVLADGTLWCWGAREGHGMGGTPDTNVPVRVPGFDDVIDVAAGYHSTCFRTESNEVHCFGRSGFGESGGSLDYEIFPPVLVSAGDPPAPLTAKSIAAGGHHHCAITMADDVVCWGRGDYGQRGSGEFSTRLGAAVELEGLSGAETLSLGENFGCAVRAGHAICWGGNTRGQIDTTLQWHSSPTDILGADTVAVGTGAFHACYAAPETAFFPGFVCHGSNSYGQLRRMASAETRTASYLGAEFEIIAGGLGFSCGVGSADGALHCWGDNYFGQLGDGTNTSRHESMAVEGITDLVSVEAGYDHVCAILADETARCWGRNREGQLGIGSSQPSHSLPVAPLRFGPEGGA